MILKGKKTTLRPIALKDAPRFVKWMNDPAVNKFLAKRKLTLKEEIKWIKGLRKDKINKIFAIDTIDGAHIGSIGLHDLDKLNKCAVYGINIGNKKYWSKGYGTDASNTILKYGFEKLKLHRIELHVYDYNKRAYALYKKLGFKKEVPMIGIKINFKSDFEKRLIPKIKRSSVFFIQLGDEAKHKSLKVIDILRQEDIYIYHSLGRDKMAGQLAMADRVKTPYILIMGKKEAMENTIMIRDVATRSQETIAILDLTNHLKKLFK